MDLIKVHQYGASNRNSFISFVFNTDDANAYFSRVDGNIVKLAQSDKVMFAMAKQLIIRAYKSDLIPVKYEYQIRSRKSRKVLRDAKGKPIKYKTGKKEGQNRREPFSPSQYYYLHDLTEAEKASKPIEKSDTILHRARTRYSTYTEKIFATKYRGVKVKPMLKKKSSHLQPHTTKKYASGTGNVTVGYTKDLRKRRRVYWEEITDKNPFLIYNRTYRTVIEEKETKSGKIRRTKKYYTDRPPHLQDIMETHIISIENGVAKIFLTAKKPKDERFYDVGGKQYAYAQYYGITPNSPGPTGTGIARLTGDKDWNRESATATSRWLEVAVGLPVPSNIKIQQYSGAEANLNKVIEVMGKEIRKVLNK